MLVVSDPYQPEQKILEIGNDKWPFPIPLVQTAGNWRFDVDQGKEAILLRRIGNNEITAIDLCRGYVEAQNEYFEQDRTGAGVRQYAQQFISSPGQRDGLYWKSTDPNDQSPIAELIAKAIAEGYTTRNQPLHGYRFKILKGQGPQAPGGAMRAPFPRPIHFGASKMRDTGGAEMSSETSRAKCSRSSPVTRLVWKLES
jgi:hypothetical protein